VSVDCDEFAIVRVQLNLLIGMTNIELSLYATFSSWTYRSSIRGMGYLSKVAAWFTVSL